MTRLTLSLPLDQPSVGSKSLRCRKGTIIVRDRDVCNGLDILDRSANVLRD